MGYVNLPPNLQAIFADLDARLNKVENAQRFTMPNTPVLTSQPTITGGTTGDPSNPRVGDIWLNTTTNTTKYVDVTGVVSTFGGGGSSLMFGPIVKTGYYYSSLGTDSSGSVALAVASTGNLELQPFYIGATATAIRIAISVTSGTVSGSVRLLIYGNASGGDYPGSLLLDAGTVATATAGSKVITISQSLPAGLYWIGYIQIAGTGNTVLQGVSSSTATGSGAAAMSFAVPSFTTALVTGVQNLAWRQTVSSPYNAPATFSGTTLLSTVGTVWLGF